MIGQSCKRPITEKRVRFNILATEIELDIIDRAAKIKGKNRSRFMVEASLKAAEK